MKNEEQTTQNLLDRIVALQQRVCELEEREAQCREQTQALSQQLAQEQATRQNVEATLHQTEAALRQSEEHRRLASERFQLAATAVSALIYDWDIESDTVERTDGLTRILGYTLTEAEPTGQWWRNRVHPEDFQRVSAEAATALATGDFYTGEYRILHKNNQYIHVLDQGLVVARNAQGKPVRVIGSTTDISARKLAQEALREREQRFSTLFNGMEDWVLVYHLTSDHQPGQFIEVNEQACKRLGYTRQELLTMSVADLVGSPWVNPKANVEKLLIDKHVVVESVHRTKDGQLLPIEVSATLFTLNGLPTVQAICRDITERKLAEEALRKSERLYRAIGETIDYGVWVCEPDGRNIYASESFLQLVGLTQEQCSDFGWGTVLHPDDADRTIAAWQECARTGDFWDIEHRFRGVDGNWHPILARGVPVRDENGEIVCWAGINLDISRLKQTEEALRQSEQRLRLALEAARMVAWEWNLVEDTLVYSDTAADVFGLRPGSRLESSEQAIALIHPEDTAYHQQIVNSAIASSGSYVAQFRLIRPIDGAVVWMEERGSVICDRSGNAVKLTGVLMNITELKQAEAALRDSEALATARAKELEVFMEAVPAGVWIAHDPQCHRVTANRTAYELVQLPSGSVATATPADGMYPFAFKIQRDGQDIPLHELPMQQAGRTGQDVEAEFDFVFENGEVRSLYGRAVPLRDNVGEVRGVIGAFLDVSERKRAEATLQRSEAKFRRLVEANMFGVAIGDFEGNMVYANDALLDTIGYTREELDAGQIRWLDLTPPEQVDLDWKAGEELRQHGVCKPFEKEYIHKDGHRVPILIGGALLDEPYDRQEQIICFYLDLSELKQTEAALREQQLLLETILKQAADATIVCDASGNLTFANATARQLAGQDPEDMTIDLNLLNWGDAYDPNGNPIPIEDYEMSKALRGETSHAVESRLVRKDGSYYDILMSAAPLIDREQIIGAVGTFMDITERKRVEEALRESVDRLNLALAASYMGDWSWDAATDVVTFSERAAEIFGIPSGPYMTWTQMRELLHEDDRDRARLMVEQAILERSDYDIDYRVIRPDGVQCWVSAKGRAQYDASGQVLGMFGVVQDITERKHAEQALQESEAIARARADELEAFMHITPVGLWIAHDPNCHHMSANKTAYDLMRAAPGSVATATPADGSYPLQFKQRRNGQEVALQDLPMQRAARTGQEIQDELEFVFEDGTVRFIYGKAVPLRNEMGDVRGVIGAFVDITERKHAEREREQLLARERAAREEAEAANRIKDEFLAVLSHELRSPLNPILGWTKLLQTRKFDEQATQRALLTIERNAKLQTQLIDDLLDVSRILRGKMDLKVYPVNLVAVIDAALETVRLAAEAKGIEIQARLAPDVGQVSGDAGRLQQVVLNLVSNAVKFTPSGGRVEIDLKRVGRDAQIQVTDTGKGIKPEFLPHVFDYFRQEDGKTTRQFGGLGLGLAIVRHLVELHGGTVQAESPGEEQGATFTVRLPLIAIAKEIAPDDIPSIATSPLARLQILVVDDIADMRELLAMILEQYGATVRVAASAADALIAIEQFKPNLLISDIGMSDIDGYMLLQQVRQLPPERGGLVPAIALTAYASEFDHQQALTAGFQKHIPKPVEPEELVKAITALLVEK